MEININNLENEMELDSYDMDKNGDKCYECNVDWLLEQLECIYQCCEESCEYNPCCKKYKKVYPKLVKCLEKCKYN